MPTLLHRPAAGTGRIHHLTPEAAGWNYVGFDLWRLEPGQAAEGGAPGRETILVLVEGRAGIRGAGRDWGCLGDRASPFEAQPPHALYLPPGAGWQAVAEGSCTLAVCTAPAAAGHPPRRLGPEGIVRTRRGEGSALRWIQPIAMEDREVADRLLVTETVTPAGNWSSWPPHRHDEDDFPRITLLEETYYHRLNPAQGFAVQRIYTEDGTLDETLAVRDHDLVTVPRGHHPCGTPQGYDLYYLNVMAGPRRAWRFQPDPAHAWLTAPPRP